MPLPYILAAGGLLLKKASDEVAKDEWTRHETRVKELEEDYKFAFKLFEMQKYTMDLSLERLEDCLLEIKDELIDFSEIFEKIKNKPEFRFKNNDKFELTYSPKKIDFEYKNISESNFVSSCAGIAGVSAVSAMLPTLSFAFPINLGAFFGVSMISSIHNYSKACDYGKEVDKVEIEVKKLIDEMKKTQDFMNEISNVSLDFQGYLSRIECVYFDKILSLRTIVKDKKDYNNFSNQEKLVLENTVLLSGILFEALKIKLVVGKNQDKINNKEIDKFISSSENALKSNNIDV